MDSDPHSSFNLRGLSTDYRLGHTSFTTHQCHYTPVSLHTSGVHRARGAGCCLGASTGHYVRLASNKKLVLKRTMTGSVGGIQSSRLIVVGSGVPQVCKPLLPTKRPKRFHHTIWKSITLDSTSLNAPTLCGKKFTRTKLAVLV